MTKPRSKSAGTALTVSPKYQVVIPREIREQLKIKPGQRVQAFVRGGSILFVPVRPIREMRGFAAGIDTDVPREDDRDL